MENKIQKIYFQNLTQLNLPSYLNINLLKIYSSPYQNLILIISNNNIIYQGKYNQSNFILSKINSEQNSNNNALINEKFIVCEFTSNNIYLITKEKNQILVSDYNFPNSINTLQGILEKKK